MMEKPVQGLSATHPLEVAKRTGSVPDASRTTRGPAHAPSGKTGERQVDAPTPDAGNALQNVATREAALPVSILKNPVLMQTEWAWRRLLAAIAQHGSDAPHPPSSMVNQANESNMPAQAPPGQNAGPISSPSVTAVSLAETAVNALWRTLATLGEQAGHDDWRATSPAGQYPGPVIPFTRLGPEDLPNMSDHVSRWVLADRLISATRTPDMPMVGGGLFVMPGQTEQPANAVRWQAERRTRTTTQGQPVHHLTLSLMVDHEPVRILFICAKPSISIRCETNHAVLRQRLEQRVSEVTAVLQGIGWRLDKWSLGALEPDEESRP